VQIAGSQSGLFGIEPPKVRIELRANKKCVSLPVSASYGFEDATGEVKLKAAENDPSESNRTPSPSCCPRRFPRKQSGYTYSMAITGTELAAPLMVDVAISK
jgi:hypothetical protein